MRGRIKKKTRDKFRRRIRDVVKDLSRPVEVYKQPIKHECFNCYYDKLTDSSTNRCKWTLTEALQKQQEYENAGGIGLNYRYFAKGRCPVCKGRGYLETVRKVWIDCKITWAPGSGNDMVYTAAGTEGSTIVELKVDPRYCDIFKNCRSIRVDGIECKLSKAPILRGLGNKSIMVVTAFTTDKPKIDSGEMLKHY